MFKRRSLAKLMFIVVLMVYEGTVISCDIGCERICACYAIQYLVCVAVHIFKAVLIALASATDSYNFSASGDYPQFAKQIHNSSRVALLILLICVFLSKSASNMLVCSNLRGWMLLSLDKAASASSSLVGCKPVLITSKGKVAAARV